MQLPAVLHTTVPWAGWVGVTLAGLSGAPLGVFTVSLPTTDVVMAVFCGVLTVSGLAVTLLGCTVMLTVLVAHTGVGVLVSHTL